MIAQQPHPPTSKVELRISCTNLTNKDVLSKSDPKVYVFSSFDSEKMVPLGKTEKINNSLNPVFKTPVFSDYYFERNQRLKFVVVDIDNEDWNDSDDFIGSVEYSMASIVSAPGSTAKLTLLSKHGHHAGNLTVSAELIRTNTKMSLAFRMSGDKFDKKDLFGKSDPYFIVSKSTPSGFVQVYQSQVKYNTLNPVFDLTEISMDELTGGDVKRDLLFAFFDYDSIGKHDFIGSFHTTAEAILSMPLKLELINQNKKEKKSSYHNSGTVEIYEARLNRAPEFMDYLMGGCEISLIAGIDCTASNLSPDNVKSLHYKHPTIPNAYANAISSIGSVLAPYDFDGMIPVFGFGGDLPGSPVTNHCFSMNLDPSSGKELDPNVRGVAGVLDVYYRNITVVSLSGPTCFAPLIKRASELSNTSQSNQKYSILMIITDGEIMDMEQTIEAIIKATEKPLSIVIIGVGSANFSSMERLDGDGGPLSNGAGMIAKRDIVQFVSHESFRDKPFYMLAEETLREIPRQFMEYMECNRIRPNPPRKYVEVNASVPVAQMANLSV
ncbi:phospholipid-binding protein [Heterostelium album PN500]|uniref:Phospholipid-binding protein n=1 Tax=Heterostelium pallidum (strain ATCC 26659 / Pp 5 / PN500) TaxID=670386 RepID=D3BM64_HETP5|nr:phospholipid-binding protein [Heterostelium album PN500]EFA77665.1 phospholipid-binding protein [Heterostelium album PN500]|eukprot:XP_020429793.1 phospholipid-binding protein [Heterostelium album PN500]